MRAACLFVLALAGCGDECREYSAFSCKELAKAEYSVVFFFPNSEKPYDLGPATGLDGCASVAYSYADEKHLRAGNDWSYVCCLHAKGSDCYEKHR